MARTNEELCAGRTVQAGIDQVYCFHEEAIELAKQLATKYNEVANWPDFEQLAVAFVVGDET